MKPAVRQLGSARHPLLERCGPGTSRRLLLHSAAPAVRPMASVSTARIARRARLEAVLLLAREPLPLRKLAELANLADGTEARSLLDELSRTYAARGSAFAVVRVAGGRQLLSRSDLAPWLSAGAPPADDLRLSPPAMETLCVVAYRQPILRAEIESIRGVQCGELLRQLMERELLRMVGRSAELGRPMLYGTTKKFLQVFGLQSLEDLPRAADLRRVDSGAESPKGAPRTSEIFSDAA